MNTFLQGAAAKALGWTLVHSLWEGAAAALALAAVVTLSRSARVRYGAACAAMVATLAGFAVTFLRMLPAQGSAGAVRLEPAAPGIASVGGALVSSWHAADLLPWLAPVWMLGVVLFQVRWIASWASASRMRRVGVCRASDEWMVKLEALRIRLGVTRAVALLESCLTEVPVVVGYAKPAILVPLGLLAGLPVGQMEAILLHELAHIRRGDYLVNLLQVFAEGVLFYHPAAWWISRVIRAERENCCDDIVVAARVDAHEYASALAALEESRIGQAALAATGGSLVKRIRRLLNGDGPRVAPAIPAGVLAVTFAVALMAWPAPQAAKPTPYQKWVTEDVVYIITAEEKQAFAGLKADEEREKFIAQFWDRRNPVPGSAENQFRKEHYRRIAYVNDRYKGTIPGWKTDRGRIYITYGPPDEIESHPSGTRAGDRGYPWEQWMYHLIQGVGTNIIIDFEDRGNTGEFHMTKDPNPPQAQMRGGQAGVMAVLLWQSEGPGQHASVALSNRQMAITVPIEFAAKAYAIRWHTARGVEDIAWSAVNPPSCGAGPDDGACIKDKFVTRGPLTLPPGSYTLDAQVRAADGSQEKSYVVKFKVN